MGAAKKIWSLKDTDANHVVDNLPLAKVKTVLLGIAPRRQAHWVAKEIGEKDWKPLHLVKEFELPPPPPSAKKRDGGLREESLSGSVAADTLEVDISNIEDRRGSQRYARNYKFLVVDKKGRFETETVNVSMTGVQLKDRLPSWIKSPFSAVIQHGDEKVMVTCTVIKGASTKKLDFKDLDPEELLRDWLLNF